MIKKLDYFSEKSGFLNEKMILYFMVEVILLCDEFEIKGIV